MTHPYIGAVRLPLHGLFNLRDLGGIATQNGQITRFGRFLRADAPLMLPEDTIRYFEELPLKISIDLRSPTERSEAPSSLAGLDRIQERHMPLINDELLMEFVSKANYDNDDLLGDFYIYLIDERGRQIADVMKEMATFGPDDGAILYHCAQGKDRTGLISALLLMLVGVRDEDIVANYQVSYAFIRPLVDPVMKTRDPRHHQLLRSDYWNMDKLLAHFHHEHGTASDYLLNCGCHPDELERLHRRLMD